MSLLETEPDEKWFAINEDGLTKKSKTGAILAMQGQYRVSFDFIETINFKILICHQGLISHGVRNMFSLLP